MRCAVAQLWRGHDNGCHCESESDDAMPMLIPIKPASARPRAPARRVLNSIVYFPGKNAKILL